jgi:hypothetical protein
VHFGQPATDEARRAKGNAMIIYDLQSKNGDRRKGRSEPDKDTVAGFSELLLCFLKIYL